MLLIFIGIVILLTCFAFLMTLALCRVAAEADEAAEKEFRKRQEDSYEK